MLELRVHPERLVSEIVVFLDQVWNPAAAASG